MEPFQQGKAVDTGAVRKTVAGNVRHAFHVKTAFLQFRQVLQKQFLQRAGKLQLYKRGTRGQLQTGNACALQVQFLQTCLPAQIKRGRITIVTVTGQEVILHVQFLQQGHVGGGGHKRTAAIAAGRFHAHIQFHKRRKQSEVEAHGEGVLVPDQFLDTGRADYLQRVVLAERSL